MKYLLTILCFGILASSGFAQTLKSLMYNTTNGQVLYTGTNSLRFVDSVAFSSDVFGLSFEAASGSNYTQVTPDGVEFSGAAQRATTRTNLGLGATWLTNTNVTDFRTAIGLGATNQVSFAMLNAIIDSGEGNQTDFRSPINFDDIRSEGIVEKTRANLGFSTNLNTLWVAENAIAARQALGLQSYTNTLTNSVGDVEIGSTVNNVTIGWTISPTNATYALRRLVGAGQTNNITNNSSTLALTSLGLINNTTWTLTVGDVSGVTNTTTTSVNFYNYMTWGRSANTSLNNAQIQSLHTSGGGAGRALATSRSRSITMDGGGQYLYIAYPQGFGVASFIVGGFPNSAFTAFTNSYTNANGYITNYLIYRTDTIQNGTGINIVIQ